MWKVTFPQNLEEWMDARCSCPSFDDDYMCKHIISIAHQLDLVEKPADDFDDEPLFKSKVGRPKDASRNPLAMD